MRTQNPLWEGPARRAAQTVERRASTRLPIEQDVQYRVLNKREGDLEARGKTLNISSSGVLFTTEDILLPGRRVELSINWPAQLDQKCALKLVARGRVVRFENGTAAIEILQHEFRTRRNRPS
jgi:c-di-GMP-binding flagellar brake protein YcgR